MIAAIYVVYVLTCLFLILVVLLQAGKGDGMGAAFGGAGSNTILGNRGAATFLSKLTVASAVLFMLLSIVLAYHSSTPGSRVGRGRVDPNQTPAALGGMGAGDDETSTPPVDDDEASPPVEDDPPAPPEDEAPSPTEDEASTPPADENGTPAPNTVAQGEGTGASAPAEGTGADAPTEGTGADAPAEQTPAEQAPAEEPPAEGAPEGTGEGEGTGS